MRSLKEHKLFFEDREGHLYGVLDYLRIDVIALKYRSKYGASKTRNISLSLSSREQTNSSTSTNNKMAVDSLIMGFSEHVSLLFLI